MFIFDFLYVCLCASKFIPLSHMPNHSSPAIDADRECFLFLFVLGQRSALRGVPSFCLYLGMIAQHFLCFLKVKLLEYT